MVGPLETGGVEGNTGLMIWPVPAADEACCGRGQAGGALSRHWGRHEGAAGGTGADYFCGGHGSEPREEVNTRHATHC